MHRLFGLLALAAAGLAAWVLVVGPAVDPLTGRTRALSEPPGTYDAWAVGLIMGLLLAWLAGRTGGIVPSWLRLHRHPLRLLVLGGLLAGALFLF